MESSGANKRTIDSPHSRSLKIHNQLKHLHVQPLLFNNKVRIFTYNFIYITYWKDCPSFVFQKTIYLADRGRPPREVITGSDKATSASFVPFASAKALPHKIRDERSISAATNPVLSPLIPIPRASPALWLQDWKCQTVNSKNCRFYKKLVKMLPIECIIVDKNLNDEAT